MRRRVLVPSFLLGLLALLVILVSIGQGISVSRTQQLQLERTSALGEIVNRAEVALADDRIGPLQSYLGRFTDTTGEAVAVIDGHGRVVAQSGSIDVASPPVDSLVLSAVRAVPQLRIPTIRPWSLDHSHIAAPVNDVPDVTAGVVVLEVDLTPARADVTRSWALISAAGLLLLAGMLVALWRWTAWVLRPVDALDAATRALADRRTTSAPTPTGPPELRRLAASFARMAQGVEDALEQQRGFVAEASHQLRNPLAAIRLRIDSLPQPARKETGATDPADASGTTDAPDASGRTRTGQVAVADDAAEAELTEAIASVDDDLDRLQRIVDRMLVLADAEHRANVTSSGDSFRTRTAAIDLGGEISVDDLIASAGTPEVRLAVEGADSVQTGFDRADLVEILEILLENAAKYAGDNATVTVSLQDANGSPTLDIRDDGPGLSDEDLEQIGRRFWRSSEHSGLPGTGLGLAIARQLALANGGDLAVDRAPEGGLRVRVRLGAA